MKCKKLKILCGIFFLAFCSLFGFSSSVYADDDLIYNITNSSHNLTDLCRDNCNDYTYLIISIDDNSDIISPFCNVFFNGYYGSNTQYGGALFYYPYTSPITYYKLDSRLTRLSLSPYSSLFTNNYNCHQSTYDITFTLTSKDIFEKQDCPVCEECKECPTIPDNPYDDKLDNIVNAIYICAATLLVIYFFYCIYRMIIRNSGVK